MTAFGRKPIVLEGRHRRAISPRYRYKFIHSAVRRAMMLPDRRILMWDLDKGRAVGLVTKTRKTITVEFR